METRKPLMQMLIEAGYPKEQMFYHYSDLYVFATPLTWRVISKWMDNNGFHYDLLNSFLFDTFIDNITGRRMYDIAFQYIEEV